MEFTATVGDNAGNFFTNNNFLFPPEDVPRDPIPPKPSIFLGRDQLLHDVAEHLINHRHVALLGTGGIGKSSIAKGLLHTETIIQTFGDQRFFVRFDSIDSSQVTSLMFFERIAKALGVKAGKHPDSSIRKYLSNPSGKMLLVLDSAETFLQAPDREIKLAIDELTDMSSVTMLLTTRIQISFKSRFETINVPPLDEEAAYATFAKIFDTDVCPPDAKILISTLQFHPLSIILLAQVAKKNCWSSEKLVKAWKQHRTRLLHNGNVKGDSLKITIELSLESPSIRERGDDARHFLRAIAFLPQGVDEEKLKDLFPKMVEVDLLAHELRNHSLLYRDGEKITMLAPIRLYLTDEGEPEPSLLADIRTYYYSQLEKFADPEQETEGAAWITTEDINVERLVALDLRAHADMQTSCQACVRFIKLLIRHKLRPTTLYPAVKSLPQPLPKLLEKVRLHVQPAFRRVHPLVSKGTCLQNLALLAEKLGQTTEALNLYKEAEKLFSLAGQRLLIEAQHYYKAVDNTNSMNNAIELPGYSGNYQAAGRRFDHLDACPLFSVQSFELQVNGSQSDIIVTVGMQAEDPTEIPSMAEPRIPFTSSCLSFHSAASLIEADFDDDISDYKTVQATITPGHERNLGSFSRGMIDENWDRRSVISRGTFETAQEPPPELLLALELLETRSPPAESPVPGFSLMSGHIHEEQSVDSRNLTTNSQPHCPLYNISFIRDVSNVCIIGSKINFTTNIMHCEDNVQVGLHTLYLRSDPAALHNSYERQKKAKKQMKAMRAWGSQISITSSPTFGEYPLSVPSIKTSDLEEVVKDVFTWLYSVSSPHLIMWLHEQDEGNMRTSLIGQCLANFLDERRDLTASYFYTKRSPSSPTGTSYSGTDEKDNRFSIIPTIAHELARRFPEIETPIASTAAKDLGIFHRTLDEQMRKLIVDPLQDASNSAGGNSCKRPQLFLIHGLEDCSDDDFQEQFLHAFGKSLTLLQQSIPQKLILLGRHTPHLRECFSNPEIKEIVRPRLLPVSQDVAV